MSNYIYTGEVSDLDITRLRKILRQNHIRRGYNPARVYRPKERQYIRDENRRSLKTTFYHKGLKQIVRPYLPEGIVIPEDNHIDLNYYRTGHYFREHKDFVKGLPDNAIQVTIILALLSTREGGTAIRVGGKRTVYNQSITRGGLLIFNSRLPHAGENVVGEKEILVLTGYLFGIALPSPKVPLQFSDYYRCIAVYSYTVDLYEDPDKTTGEDHYLVPVFYIYANNLLRFIVSTDLSEPKGLQAFPVNIDGVSHVNCYAEEELALIGEKNPYIFSQISDKPDDSMGKVLTRKCLLEIFRHLEKSKSKWTHEVIYEYESEDDFCNGWDEYGGGGGRSYSRYIEEEYTKITCSKTFSISLPNQDYYNYWLGFLHHLPTSLYDSITSYLVY